MKKKITNPYIWLARRTLKIKMGKKCIKYFIQRDTHQVIDYASLKAFIQVNFIKINFVHQYQFEKCLPEVPKI